MKEIHLEDDYVALVDDEDYARLASFQWHVAKPRTSRTVYAYRYIRTEGGKQKRVMMHPEIVPRLSAGMVDHQDGNGLNNQRANLRPSNRSQNAANSGSRGGTSKFKGVVWDHKAGKWAAHIRGDGRSLSPSAGAQAR